MIVQSEQRIYSFTYLFEFIFLQTINFNEQKGSYWHKTCLIQTVKKFIQNTGWLIGPIFSVNSLRSSKDTFSAYHWLMTSINVTLLGCSQSNFVFHVEMLLCLVSLYLMLLWIARLFHFFTSGTKWSVCNRIECIPYMNDSTFFFSW